MTGDPHDDGHDDDERYPSRFVTVLIVAIVVAAMIVAYLGRERSASVPEVANPVSLIDKPDFRAIPDPTTRKTRFFDYLKPAVERVNAEVREQRARLLEIEAARGRGKLARAERHWLAGMAERYRVKAESPAERIVGLKRRLDTLPGALVVAQAAIESGWGTSRFAREGNNLFGEWCFEPGCGMVPAHRPEGAEHEVRWFPGVTHSIRSYFRNLNSHPAYEELRARRAEARAAGRNPTALELAAGLQKYSERGGAYVDDVRTVIRANDLDRLYTAAAERP